MSIGKEKIKSSLFTDHMILYAVNFKYFIAKEVNSAKFAGYKIKLQKSLTSLYTNSEQPKNYIKIIPFIVG